MNKEIIVTTNVEVIDKDRRIGTNEDGDRIVYHYDPEYAGGYMPVGYNGENYYVGDQFRGFIKWSETKLPFGVELRVAFMVRGVTIKVEAA